MATPYNSRHVKEDIMKKITTKQIAIGGVLLAIMIVSMLFKNVSPFITGPIVNTVLVIVTLTLGLYMGIIFSIIAPVFAFCIAHPPVQAAAPLLILPAIAVGNIIMVVAVYVFYKRVKNKIGLPIGLVIGSVAKALFMGAVIAYYILPAFCASKFEAMGKPQLLAIGQKTFSITQLLTALIASVIVILIWIPAGKYLVKEAKE